MSEAKGGGIGDRMAAVMRDLEAVGKNRKNEAQRYNFRGIDDLYNALHPVLADHGVHLLVDVLDRIESEPVATKSGGVQFRVALRCRVAFVAPDGSERACVLWGEGMDTGDKATNKATSAAIKYALLSTFAVPTEDNELRDSERDSPEAVAAPRQRAPQGSPTNRDAPKLDTVAIDCQELREAVIDALPTCALGEPERHATARRAMALESERSPVKLRALLAWLKGGSKGPVPA